MAVRVSPEITNSLDAQLKALHDDMLELFMCAFSERKDGHAPLIGSGTGLLDGLIQKPHYVAWSFPITGNWDDPLIPFNTQPALLNVVKHLQGFIAHKQTITGFISQSAEGPYFEAKLYSRVNFSLPPRILLRAYPSMRTSTQHVRLVVTYCPKT